MVSPADASGPEPVDPAFASLFRPEEDVPRPPTPEPAPVPAPEPLADEPSDPQPGPGPTPGSESLDDPAAALPAATPAAPAAEAPDPSVDTGRLFRSQGVAGHSEAVLAVSSDHGRRLRTLERGAVEAPPPVVIPTGLAADRLAAHADAIGVVAADEPRRGRRRRSQSSDAAPMTAPARGITGGAVYLIVIGGTLLVALANALLTGGDISWPTGLALAVTTVYCALTVRRDDDIVAVISPPLAVFVAALTAGQFFLGSADHSLVNRAVVVFFTLADNWIWIIGSTLAAAVIVAVRRRRG